MDGVTVPSVTTIIGILDKPALPHWAAKLTVEGVWRLVKRKGYKLPDSPEKLKQDLAHAGLAHTSATDDSIVRGRAVHKALEDWITRRKVPTPADYPRAHRGYMRGLCAFLVAWEPKFQDAETLVASAKHGFAGTRDTIGLVEHEEHGRVLLDLKTSARVYPKSHFPQLAAYEMAAVECGEQPTDKQGIVRVGGDGSFEVVWSCATAEDFLCILEVYKSQHALEARANERKAKG